MATGALQVCRTCMRKRHAFVNLFELIKDKKYLSPITFADILKICTPVQAIQEDGLPQSICEFCSKILTDTYAFRNQCEKNDEILRKKNANPSEMNKSTLFNDKAVKKIENNVSVYSEDKNKIKPYVYNCNDCDKQFTDVRKIEKHVKIHFKNKFYNCELCNKKFFTVAMLTKHSVEHGEIHCVRCSKKFETKYHLMKHVCTHLSLQCYLCEERFSSNKALSDHIIIHRHNSSPDNTSNDSSIQQSKSNIQRKKYKIYRCRYCKRRTMTTHIKTHVKIEPYICEICSHTFTSLTNLNKHKSVHCDIKQWECHHCKKRFSTEDDLEQHVLIHTVEKPYKCKYCDKTFNQTNNLMIHYRLHIGENIYNCTLCSEKFKLSSELKLHYPVHFINKEISPQKIEDVSLMDTND